MDRIRWIALAAATLGGAPAAAQHWEPGTACTAFLTVQSSNCEVTTYWRCDLAPEGYVFEATHDADGRSMAAIYDREFQWLDTTWGDGWRDVLIQPSADPISTSNLLATGLDAYDFELMSSGPDPVDGVTLTRVRGVDILLGETVEIDGMTLERTSFMNTFARPDGRVTDIGRGLQYFSREHGLFFLGQEEWITDDGIDRYDATPVAFILPGEPGFGATTPEHGCEGGVAGDNPAPKDESGAKGN